MVLISLCPFVPKRVLALIAAVLALLAVTCLAKPPLLIPVTATPYDQQMARVTGVLHEPRALTINGLAFRDVNAWMEKLRALPYRFSAEWKAPTEVQFAQEGDCKGKAVALYELMRQHGANDLRVVIGKRAPESCTTHVWLEWTTPSGVFLLDPTIQAAPLLSSDAPANYYVGYYAFTGAEKYCVVGSEL